MITEMNSSLLSPQRIASRSCCSQQPQQRHLCTPIKAAAVCLERLVTHSSKKQQRQQQRHQWQRQQDHAVLANVDHIPPPPLRQSPSSTPDDADNQQQQLLLQQPGRRRRRRRPFSGDTSSSSDIPPQTITVSSSSSSRRRRRWTPMHSKLLQALRQHEVMIPKHARVLLAVSGGQDSMAMLTLLHDLSQQGHWPLQLVVAHCDHRVRPDSGDNAAHVQRASEALGLTYLQATADRDQGHWPEAAARQWRHQELVSMALQAGCGHLALGHTATERAETVLFNLIRGAGTRGLGAMGRSRQLPQGVVLVRPLLDCTRPQTLAACELTGTQFYPDSTNEDPCYVRNRLRMSVFPQLLDINPAAIDHIVATAEIVRLECDYVSSAVAKCVSAAVVPCHIVNVAAAAAAAATAAGSQPQQQQPQGGSGPAEAAGAGAAAAAGGGVGVQGPDSSREGDGVAGEEAGPMSALSAVPWLSGQDDSSSKAVHRACLDQVFAQPAAPRTRRQQQQQQLVEPQLPSHQQQQPPHHGEVFVHALRPSVVVRLHPALRHRVVHAWLSQQTVRAVEARQVGEVMRLLLRTETTGNDHKDSSSTPRTSTLWGSSCVVRHKALLLLLDSAMMQRVLSGEVQVECVSVDAGALKATAVCMNANSSSSSSGGSRGSSATVVCVDAATQQQAPTGETHSQQDV